MVGMPVLVRPFVGFLTYLPLVPPAHKADSPLEYPPLLHLRDGSKFCLPGLLIIFWLGMLNPCESGPWLEPYLRDICQAGGRFRS